MLLWRLAAPIAVCAAQDAAPPPPSVEAPADGPYKRLGADGGVAAEGEIKEGRPHGAWRTYHPGGAPRTAGEFNAGLRTGKWEFWWPNGQLAASGRYSRGLRDDIWNYWSESGEKLDARSGKYRQQLENYPPPDKLSSAPRRMVWETRDGLRDGALRAFWPDGSLQCEGEFSRGVRVGTWTFWRIDGSLETEAISGVYVDGVRSLEAQPAADPFAIPEEHPPAPAPALARVPRLSAAPGVTPSEADQFRPWIDLLVRGAVEERERATQAVLAHGYKVAPNVVNELRALDLSTEAGNQIGEMLVERVLRPLVAGRGWAWSHGEGAVEANVQTVIRWSTWCALATRDETLWSSYCAWLASTPAADSGDLLLVDLIDAESFPPSVGGGGRKASAGSGGASGPDASSSDSGAPAPVRLLPNTYFTARARVRPSADVRSAIEDAARWLVAHQSDDGSWLPGSFMRRCGAIGEGVCDGIGEGDKLVGVTGLALLALFASGDEPHRSPHAEAMTKAVSWLLSQQDPEDGLYGQRVGLSYVYGHAIATQAMVEAWLATGDPRVGRSVERAVELIVGARSKMGGWRYEIPSVACDTSVTAWMASALCAARDAGFDVPDSALSGVDAYLRAMTDPATGRTGYDAVGTASARLAAVNQDFPSESGEALTAAALFTRSWIGRKPTSGPLAGLGFGLIAAKPPVWSPVDRASDFYYVFWASHAFAGQGGKAAATWQDQLRVAFLSNQRRDKKLDTFGSWDPIDAWGFAGGRLQSTCLLMLAFSAPARCVSAFSAK